ncbi:MAG: UDP-N-acetylglucosamine 2-epimerase (non-hydrolyzing) [Flavobacteriales bacterium]|nr:UDP-N-acetylglucosamine 2-epimerase (non-hydrolyzing) [Flavobacteriales bacterium]
MKNVLFVLGTRPELIKLFPLINAFKSDIGCNVQVCVTGQHKELLEDLFDFFHFQPDTNLHVMKENQSLSASFTAIMQGLQNHFASQQFEYVFVQGDTNSAFAGALFGYYNQIKVVHIEAGLRSGDIYSPFPEEGNRKLIGQVANFHFCATEEAAQNLRSENLNENVFVVGNTVIDTLLYTLKKIEHQAEKYESLARNNAWHLSEQSVLVTIHRRENFGEPLRLICEAIEEFALENPEVNFMLPVHPNRNGQFIREHLNGVNNVQLIDPLPYDQFVYLMRKAKVLMSDSGGIQEEAISCNKPILILRENTERPEVVNVGAGMLVHCDKQKIKSELNLLLQDTSYYQQRINKINPFGDGKSSLRIKELIENIGAVVEPSHSNH